MDNAVIGTAVLTVLQHVVNSFDEDDEDDESDVEDLIYCFGNRKKVEKIPRAENFMKTVYRMTDGTFKSHFRLRRDTVDFLIKLVGDDLNKQSDRYGRNSIPVEKQVLLALWTMATPDSYRSVCNLFDVGKATAWRTVWKFVRALYNRFTLFIKWPSPEEAKTTWRYIHRRFAFPGVLGAIDGTHIRIAQPKVNPECYINRKGYHSLQTQLVCDHQLKFIHVYAGQVGSVHDSRVFGLSGLQNYCNEEYFPENSHLLGDKAYAIQKHIMVPYRNNGNLGEEEFTFNTAHSAARLMIERSIGMLKGRFRSLLDKLPFRRTDLIPYYIVACCVLHNICIMRDDLIEIPILINDDVPNPDNSIDYTAAMRRQGLEKREQLKNIINN